MPAKRNSMIANGISRKPPMIITFDDVFKERILDMFGKTLKDGIIVDESGEPVPARDGSYIHKSEFAGIQNGSEIFIKNDITSLIQYAHRK